MSVKTLLLVGALIVSSLGFCLAQLLATSDFTKNVTAPVTNQQQQIAPASSAGDVLLAPSNNQVAPIGLAQLAASKPVVTAAPQQQLPVAPNNQLASPPTSNQLPQISLNQSANPVSSVAAAQPVNEKVRNFQAFKNSSLFIEPFESGMLAIPKIQAEFVRKMATDDLEFYRTILREAIDKRFKFAPSVSLMFKYSAKILARIIKNYKLENQLPDHVKYKSEFFKMLSTLIETALDKSAKIKKEREYTKQSVNTDEMYHRTNAVFNWIERVIQVSPVAGYLKWNETVLYRNEVSIPRHDLNFIDEAADLLAVSVCHVSSVSSLSLSPPTRFNKLTLEPT